jgi:hypothetical protein
MAGAKGAVIRDFAFRHCERSEAIQFFAWAHLDGFVAEFIIGPLAPRHDRTKRKGPQLALEPLNGQGIAGYVPEPELWARAGYAAPRENTYML